MQMEMGIRNGYGVYYAFNNTRKINACAFPCREEYSVLYLIAPMAVR